jgi:hypothetical protein
MMLAFLVDQAQELGCRLWQAARARFRSRTSLWERLRVLFTGFYIPDWKTLTGQTPRTPRRSSYLRLFYLIPFHPEEPSSSLSHQAFTVTLSCFRS